MKSPSFHDLGFAKTEGHRIRRQGFPEAIYCPGKSDDHVIRIFESLLRGPGPVIATRVHAVLATRLLQRFPQARHNSTAKTVVACSVKKASGRQVLIITAGTADLPVAEEAAVTLEALGRPTERLYDVGVSGLHRLLSRQRTLGKAAAIIVCAGMDGALPSVVGGLAKCPVVAVPTSIGYGAHLGGIASLLTMLNSCAANVSVVNIDNGFGAAVVASLIAR